MKPKKMHNDAVNAMDFGDDKVRMNVEDDRLSRLPDDLIHKILSFISIREAIGMSVLSCRWRFIWTSMPYLNFTDEDCNTSPPPDFSRFVSNVLSLRKNEIQAYSVKFAPWGGVSLEFFKTVVNYLVSHNLQQLSFSYTEHYMDFCFPFFSSLSLKHLSLRGFFCASDSTMATTWQLPALTTLHLDNVDLMVGYTDKYTGVFSRCPNLKNLFLYMCRIWGTIYHPRLSNLTLENTYVEGFSVAAPQLENLTLLDSHVKHLVSAPNLTSLLMKGNRFGGFFTDTQAFPSLEKLDICIYMPSKRDAGDIFYLLRQLPSVKSLTLNLEILELFSFMGVTTCQLSWLGANLKISKILYGCPERVYLEVQAPEIKDNGISLGDICSYELVELMERFVFAQKLMDKTRVLLKTVKANSDINKAQMEKANAPAKAKRYQDSTLEMQWHFWETMVQIEQGLMKNHLPTSEACDMISYLHDIEGSLTRLHASKRAALQPTFSSLCEDAAILINDMKARHEEIIKS